eukprot:scaffold472392_cov25-Prasinocladus_malaysianus.AAC.1
MAQMRVTPDCMPHDRLIERIANAKATTLRAVLWLLWLIVPVSDCRQLAAPPRGWWQDPRLHRKLPVLGPGGKHAAHHTDSAQGTAFPQGRL